MASCQPVQKETLLILPTPGPTPTPVDLSREQYYRGIYDVCVYFGSKEHPKKLVKVACRQLLSRTINGQWYEGETIGWEWPLREETLNQ